MKVYFGFYWWIQYFSYLRNNTLNSLRYCWINPNADLAKLRTLIISAFKFLPALTDLLPAGLIVTLRDKKKYMTISSLCTTLVCPIAELPNFWIRRDQDIHWKRVAWNWKLCVLSPQKVSSKRRETRNSE